MKESSSVEFKKEFSKTFLKTVSAFANDQTGEIIFGIDGEGNVFGVENPNQLKMMIENSIQVTLPILKLNQPNIDQDEFVVYESLKSYERSSSEVSKITGFGKTKTVEILNKLLENGYIKRTGKARGTKYRTR